MNFSHSKLFAALSMLLLVMLWSDPADAFRCKSKLVKDGMHEVQVIAVCGQPTTVRQLGYALRSYNLGYRNSYPGGISTGHSHPGSHTEVLVTEYVYNFGPRKLMRRLIFEGGVLTQIESIGYGFINK